MIDELGEWGLVPPLRRMCVELEPEAWIVDDTGFAKKGRFSVGVGRQYARFARTTRSSQGDWLTNCCSPCSSPSGNRSAIGSMLLRLPSSINPRRYTPLHLR